MSLIRLLAAGASRHGGAEAKGRVLRYMAELQREQHARIRGLAELTASARRRRTALRELEATSSSLRGGDHALASAAEMLRDGFDMSEPHLAFLLERQVAGHTAPYP